MRIVTATDSFKGSLSSAEVAQHLARGLTRGWPDLDVVELPISDGGEGLVDSLVRALGGQWLERQVTGPLGQPVAARFGLLPGEPATAVIEMAAASGLTLVPKGRLDPFHTTTRGTGELIRHALDAGARRLVVGIGGSATNEGGAGMAQALGARLLDDRNREIGPGAAGLQTLRRIDLDGLDPRLAATEVIVACDVDNPLCGSQGAAAVYGPQKGAAPDDVPVLDAALAHYADIVEKSLGGSFRDVPGAGAAGGLGFGLMALLGARLRPGIELVLEEINAPALFATADLVITGEGRMDRSTLHGKLPVGVARAARAVGARVIAVCGGLAEPAETFLDAGIEAVFSLTDGPMDLEEAMRRAPRLVEDLGVRLGRLLRLGAELSP